MASALITISGKNIRRFLILIIVISLGCAPKPVLKPTPPITVIEIPAPFNLDVKTGNRQATLLWSINRSDSIPISGYNIYISDNSISDSSTWKANPGSPYIIPPYPGDTDGDTGHETMPLDRLSNGHRYFALVRTVGPDNRESKSSNVIEFTPLARGEFTISIDHNAPTGGFNFENEKSVPARDPRCDIYLYATESKIGLSSPDRLGAGLRKTRFQEPSLNGNQLETVKISRGDWLMVETKTGQAKIQIENIQGNYPDISARISYIYYPGNN